MIDLETSKALRDLYDAGHYMAKFCVDVRYWDAEATRIAKFMGLADYKGWHVLDVGCGFGYFVNACRRYGHRAAGLDKPDPLIMKATTIMGVPFISRDIQPTADCLDDLGNHWDLITMFGVNFKRRDGEYWDRENYAALGQAVRKCLAPGGQWILRPNQTSDQQHPVRRLADAGWWGAVMDETAIVRIELPEVIIRWTPSTSP